jgi:hypothetical protein
VQPSGYLEFLQEHTRCPSRNAPGPEATPLQSVFLAWPSLPLRPALRAADGGGTTVMTVMMAGGSDVSRQCHTETVAMLRAAVGHSETAQSMV